MHRILIVEEDRYFRETFSELLGEDGYAVEVASTAEEALHLIDKNDYKVVITALNLRDKDGMKVLAEVKRKDPASYVIMVTGHADVETARQALKNGATDYLIKPINRDEFRHIVAQCLEQRRLLDENLELKELVNLYQVSQTIANCLELERIYPLLMDALTKEIGVGRGLGYFCEGGPLKLQHVRGMDETKAALLGEMILAKCDRSDAGENICLIEQLLLPDDFGLQVSQALCLVLRHKGTLHGVIVLLNDPGVPFPPEFNRKNITFLLDQSALAVENAARYHYAKDLLYIDELTGLNNYRYLDVVLERELRRLERYGSELSVLFLDLDHFKLVNDAHGHMVGSKVLQEVGMLLRASVRDVDAVIRYGGDEFTVVLIETGMEGAAIVAERIRSMVEAYLFGNSDGLQIKLTVSLGYACSPHDAKTKVELLKLADQAMYRGKSSGKNKVFHVGSEQ
ncbi:GGDEF domain-containing response regulator [Geomesophilobacter sediminis]|uniref:diguanylate cyclase n=1 Tax=Geomesophilobacter sediminis TaxID=2798584 RepID=A0A8J7SD66_9BACT|nr:diguanylate cyclase [Geomesophilobacter sediminis]MBJ6727634.1 diguanylate cyclase [Geomesophilobacter sediminis]